LDSLDFRKAFLKNLAFCAAVAVAVADAFWLSLVFCMLCQRKSGPREVRTAFLTDGVFWEEDHRRYTVGPAKALNKGRRHREEEDVAA